MPHQTPQPSPFLPLCVSSEAGCLGRAGLGLSGSRGCCPRPAPGGAARTASVTSTQLTPLTSAGSCSARGASAASPSSTWLFISLSCCLTWNREAGSVLRHGWMHAAPQEDRRHSWQPRSLGGPALMSVACVGSPAGSRGAGGQHRDPSPKSNCSWVRPLTQSNSRLALCTHSTHCKASDMEPSDSGGMWYMRD